MIEERITDIDNSIQSIADKIREEQGLKGYNLAINNVTTKEFNGIKITRNNDGTLTFNGTSTSLIILNILNDYIGTSAATEAIDYVLDSGEYYLSAGFLGSPSTYKLDIWELGGTSIFATVYDSEKKFTLQKPTHIGALRVVIYNNVTMDNVILKPIISNISKAPYEAYCQYKLREMPQGIEDVVDHYKQYIPKRTSENGICENAIPLNASAEVEGNSWQDSTEGYNLCPSLENGEWTLSNGAIIENGVLSLPNMDSRATSDFIEWNYKESLVYIQWLQVIGDNMHGNIEYYDENKISLDRNGVSTKVSPNDIGKVNFATTSKLKLSKYVKIMFQRSTSYAPNPYSIKNIQVALDDKPYEPYTNGPSPNPEYPQKIEVIDNGWNLAYDGWAEDFVNRINNSVKAKLQNFDNKNCLFYRSDVSYPETDSNYVFKTKWKENTQYTFKFDMFPISQYSNLEIIYTDGTHSGSPASLKPNEWQSLKLVSNVNKTIKYLKVYFASDSNYIDLDTFMIYEGTEDKPYLPYGNIGLVQRGINLLKPNPKSIGESVEVKIINGVFYVKNNSSSAKYISGLFGAVNASERSIILDSKKTYRMHMIKNTTDIQVVARYNNGQIPLTTTNEDNRTISNIEYFREIFAYLLPNAEGWIKIQLSEGTKDYPFEPYIEPKLYDIDLQGNFIGKITNKDILSVSDKGIVELEKKIGKVVLNGSEDWRKLNTSFQTGGVIPKDLDIYKENVSALSNYLIYKYYASGITSNLKNGEFGWNVDKHLTIRNDNCNTVDEFKQWLSNNDVEIYYPLKTPQKIQLPTTEPIKMFEGTNIFELVSNLDSDFKIQYYFKCTE